MNPNVPSSNLHCHHGLHLSLSSSTTLLDNYTFSVNVNETWRSCNLETFNNHKKLKQSHYKTTKLTFLCSFCAWLLQGNSNILYITMFIVLY